MARTGWCCPPVRHLGPGLGSALWSPNDKGGLSSPPSLWMHSLCPCCGRKSQVLPLPELLGIPSCKNASIADGSRRSQRLSSPLSPLGWAVPCPASPHPPWSCSLDLAPQARIGTSLVGVAHQSCSELWSWGQRGWYLLDREMPAVRGKGAACCLCLGWRLGWGQARLGPPRACPCVLINHRVNLCLRLPWVLQIGRAHV